jgi:probable F420-dependent oxidoreductase
MSEPQFGVVFPQYEIGTDVGVIRSFFETAEGFGFRHVLAYDHVLGAGRTTRPEWTGLYDSTDAFHEPMVLFGFMAAVAPTLAPVTAILVLPQRQTALVAKQAAQVDLFSGGRMRLGVGVGWNELEFDGLGSAAFHRRGGHMEDQIDTLRALWTNDVVTRQTATEKLVDTGINPLPVQRPIPIWIGGLSTAALQRAGRMADGWLPMQDFSADQVSRVGVMREAAAAAGRDPMSLGIDSVMSMWRVPRERWAAEVESWRGIGATHISASTLRLGLSGAEHIKQLELFARDLIG